LKNLPCYFIFKDGKDTRLDTAKFKVVFFVQRIENTVSKLFFLPQNMSMPYIMNRDSTYLYFQYKLPNTLFIKK
tara:strand:+ start:1208 stop:1429 length:222 start_codon:yes stop_codon:yes gene_type:complete